MGNQRELVIEMLKCIKGGQAVAASYLGISLSVFKDRLYENKGTRFFTCDELLALQELSETTLVADYFARNANCVVVPKVDVEAGKYDLFTMSMNISSERGKLEEFIKKATDDGEIDEKEEKIINELKYNLVKARIEFLQQVIATHKKATNGN